MTKQSGQLERNRRLKDHRVKNRCLEKEAAVRKAVGIWKKGGFCPRLVEQRAFILPPNVVKLPETALPGTEVALFDGKKKCYVVGTVVSMAQTRKSGKFVVCRVESGLSASPLNYVFEWT